MTDGIHPMAQDALEWIKHWRLANLNRWAMYKESFASNAIEGNQLATACLETMERIDEGKGVGPQYILGLAWFLHKPRRKNG